MFFFPPGLTKDESEKIFKLINQSRKKEEERQTNLKKEQEKQKEIAKINKMFAENPSTSFSSIMAYGHMISYINNKYK
jgi:hypothetical protein